MTSKILIGAALVGGIVYFILKKKTEKIEKPSSGVTPVTPVLTDVVSKTGSMLFITWASGKTVTELVTASPDQESLRKEFEAFMGNQSISRHKDVTWAKLDGDPRLESQFETWLQSGSVADKSVQDWVAGDRMNRFTSAVAIGKQGGLWSEKQDYAKWRNDHQNFLTAHNWFSDYAHVFRVVGGSIDPQSGAVQRGYFGGYWANDDQAIGGDVSKAVIQDPNKLNWARYFMKKNIFEAGPERTARIQAAVKRLPQ